MSTRRSLPVLPALALLLAVLATGCEEFPTGGVGYFVVNSTVDGVDALPGDARCATARGTCTLRAAVMESNAMPGANTVSLPAGTYVLSLAGAGGAEVGDLDVTGDLRIQGAGTGASIVDGNKGVLRDRIFRHSRARFQLLDLTLRNAGGAAYVTSGGILYQEAGVLLLRRVLLTGGGSFSAGGALTLQAGLASIEDSTIDANSTDSRGGGIAISTDALVGIDRSTISRNTAALGAGIYNGGGLTIYDSTVSGNSARAGTGGINTFNDLTLDNVTITQNSAGVAEGRAGGLAVAGGSARLANTIIADNVNTAGGSPDCAGTLTSRGYNLVRDTTGCTLAGDTTGNLTGVDPQLAPLASNGGPTQTHLLGIRSPARNAGNPGPVVSTDDTRCRPTDQRGVARPVDGRCDMGATEQ